MTLWVRSSKIVAHLVEAGQSIRQFLPGERGAISSLQVLRGAIVVQSYALPYPKIMILDPRSGWVRTVHLASSAIMNFAMQPE
jgi:hypothetical protein